MAEVGGAHPWGQLKLTGETCGETCRAAPCAMLRGKRKWRNQERRIGRRKEEGGREEGGGGGRE